MHLDEQEYLENSENLKEWMKSNKRKHGGFGNMTMGRVNIGTVPGSRKINKELARGTRASRNASLPPRLQMEDELAPGSGKKSINPVL